MIMNMISFRDETIKRIDANANTFVAVLTNQKWSDDVLEIAEVGIEEEKISVSRKNHADEICFIDDYTMSNITTLAEYLKAEYGQIVSQVFIKDTIVKWIFEIRTTGEKLSSYLQDTMNKSIKSYRFAFPIHHAFFSEGNLCLHVTEDVTFETLLIPEQVLNISQNLLSLDRNLLFVCTTVVGENNYAREAAFDKCSFAVDIFKLCSEFSRNPHNTKSLFDIRDENIIKDVSLFFYWDLNSNEKDEIHVSTSLNSHPSKVDKAYINYALKNNLKEFSYLYSECYSDNPSSIALFLKRAIRKHSSATSEHEKHDRIESLCSVMDMLVLNQKGSIVQSLKKYVPVLIEDNPEKREDVASFIGKMYNIRSQHLHHDNQIDVSWQDVYFLNYIVFNLIYRIMILRDRYDDIESIYKDIDRTMNNIVFHPLTV